MSGTPDFNNLLAAWATDTQVSDERAQRMRQTILAEGQPYAMPTVAWWKERFVVSVTSWRGSKSLPTFT